jgi:hypothetical protein
MRVHNRVMYLSARLASCTGLGIPEQCSEADPNFYILRHRRKWNVEKLLKVSKLELSVLCHSPKETHCYAAQSAGPPFTFALGRWFKSSENLRTDLLCLLEFCEEELIRYNRNMEDLLLDFCDLLSTYKATMSVQKPKVHRCRSEIYGTNVQSSDSYISQSVFSKTVAVSLTERGNIWKQSSNGDVAFRRRKKATWKFS